jgi:ABC-2 type transport system ATP-binding protein
MIETHDLSKNFGDFTAVDGVTLDVQAGEVLALLGPNGAGKTTTVRMLTSVLRPTRGTATIAGYDVVQHPDQVRAAVGVLTEQHGLYGRMPGDEYLDFFGQLYRMDKTTRRKRVSELLERFGLGDARHRKVGEYSKGMRQKIALARALIHDPPVLLLDEPTSAMDPESARLVRNAIKDLRSAERAIVLCTHNLAEAEELADQIAIIRRGKIITQGTPAGLKQELLGPGEYEIELAIPLNGRIDALLTGVEVTSQGENWFRYRTDHPEQANPIVLRILLEAGMPVVRLQEAERSLEQVYLQAIHAPEEVEHAA